MVKYAKNFENIGLHSLYNGDMEVMKYIINKNPKNIKELYEKALSYRHANLAAYIKNFI